MTFSKLDMAEALSDFVERLYDKSSVTYDGVTHTFSADIREAFQKIKDTQKAFSVNVYSPWILQFFDDLPIFYDATTIEVEIYTTHVVVNFSRNYMDNGFNVTMLERGTRETMQYFIRIVEKLAPEKIFFELGVSYNGADDFYGAEVFGRKTIIRGSQQAFVYLAYLGMGKKAMGLFVPWDLVVSDRRNLFVENPGLKELSEYHFTCNIIPRDLDLMKIFIRIILSLREDANIYIHATGFFHGDIEHVLAFWKWAGDKKVKLRFADPTPTLSLFNKWMDGEWTMGLVRAYGELALSGGWKLEQVINKAKDSGFLEWWYIESELGKVGTYRDAVIKWMEISGMIPAADSRQGVKALMSPKSSTSKIMF